MAETRIGTFDEFMAQGKPAIRPIATGLRHAKERSIEDADTPAIRALIGAALAERKAVLGG